MCAGSNAFRSIKEFSVTLVNLDLKGISPFVTGYAEPHGCHDDDNFNIPASRTVFWVIACFQTKRELCSARGSIEGLRGLTRRGFSKKDKCGVIG
jgi:hypothetical protein